MYKLTHLKDLFTQRYIKYLIVILLNITTFSVYGFENFSQNSDTRKGIIPATSEYILDILNTNYDTTYSRDLSKRVISYDIAESGDNIVILEEFNKTLKISLLDYSCNILWAKTFQNNDTGAVSISDKGDKILLSLSYIDDFYNFTHILFNKSGNIISTQKNSDEMLNISPSGEMLYIKDVNLEYVQDYKKLYYYNIFFEKQHITGLDLTTNEDGIFTVINNFLVVLKMKGNVNHFELYTFYNGKLGRQLKRFTYNKYIDFPYSAITHWITANNNYIYFNYVNKLYDTQKSEVTDLAKEGFITILSNNNSRISYRKEQRGFKSNVVLNPLKKSDKILKKLDITKLLNGYHSILDTFDDLIVIEHVVASKGALIYDIKSEKMFHFEGIVKKIHQNELLILDNNMLLILKRKEKWCEKY